MFEWSEIRANASQLFNSPSKNLSRLNVKSVTNYISQCLSRCSIFSWHAAGVKCGLMIQANSSHTHTILWHLQRPTTIFRLYLTTSPAHENLSFRPHLTQKTCRTTIKRELATNKEPAWYTCRSTSSLCGVLHRNYVDRRHLSTLGVELYIYDFVRCIMPS